MSRKKPDGESEGRGVGWDVATLLITEQAVNFEGTVSGVKERGDGEENKQLHLAPCS